jgi:hypothetical protein
MLYCYITFRNRIELLTPLIITLNTAYGNVVPIELGDGALLKQYSFRKIHWRFENYEVLQLKKQIILCFCGNEFEKSIR